MLTVYLATAMTGRDRKQLVQEAKDDVKTFAKYGIKAFSPVIEEHIPNKTGRLTARKSSLIHKWKDDKAAMRVSFAIVDRTADMKSEGVQHETGFMRYGLWRVVVRVSPRHAGGYFSVANLEDDIIVGSVDEAASFLLFKYGTWYKRFKWQMKIINRCILRFIWDHLRGLLL